MYNAVRCDNTKGFDVNEITWTQKLTKQMRDVGALVVPYVGNTRQINGFPDRIIISSIIGAIVLVEFKGLTTKVTHMQANFHVTANRQAPGCCFLVRAPDIVTLVSQGARFDGTGLGLLHTIKQLRRELNIYGDGT